MCENRPAAELGRDCARTKPGKQRVFLAIIFDLEKLILKILRKLTPHINVARA